MSESPNDPSTDATAPGASAASPEVAATTAAQPKKGRWRKRIMWTVLLLLLFIGLSPLLLSLSPVRNYVAGKVSDALGQEVEIGSAFAFWGHGVDLENVRVANPEGFEGDFATVEKIHADVDVLSFVFGRGAATVEVDAPHVMLRANGTARNIDAFTKKDPDATKEASTSSGKPGPDINLTVKRGVVEAFGFGGMRATDAPARIDAIEATFAMNADEGLRADLGALFRQMQKGGGDARVEGGIEMDASGQGPVRFKTPALDLARLAPIVEGFTGVAIQSGTLEVGADGKFVSENNIQGTAFLRGERLEATLPDGATVKLSAIKGSLGFRKQGEDTAVRLKVGTNDLEYRRPDGKTFREALVSLSGEGAITTTGFRISSARLQAAGALGLEVEQPIEIITEPVLTATGALRIDANLTTLQALRVMEPRIEMLESGQVAARARFNKAERLDVTVSMLAQNLAVKLGDEAGSVYRDPRIVVTGRFRQVAEDVRQFDLLALQSNAIESTGLSAERPFVVRMDPGGIVLDGPLDFLVKLQPLSAALPSRFGLNPGESLQGTLAVKGQAKGAGSTMDLTGTLAGRGLVFPARMGVAGQNSLDATFAVARSDAGTDIDVSRIAGSGLEGSAKAKLVATDASASLQDAAVDMRIDLARARPLIGGLIGLDPAATLAGLVTMNVVVRPEAGGNGVTGTTKIQNLVWQGDAASTPLRQEAIAFTHDLLLAEGEGASTVRALALTLQGLRADLAGSTWTSSAAGTTVDLRAALSGDAGGLAPTLRSLLGPDYADLQGSGPVAGTLTVRGPTADSGAALVGAGRLQFGTWTTSGVTAANSTLILERKTLPGHQMVLLRSTINKGPTEIDLGITPGPTQMPWALRVKARGVDTGSMLTNEGPGKYMAYALPSLLPADSNVPVLSGLLDVDANLQAKDIASPVMGDSLGGTASLSMTQGEIRNSTLFQAVGGGGSGLGKGMALLKQVPGVGDVLQGASRALVFTSLESKMRIGVRQVVVDAMSLKGRYITVAMNGVARFDETLEMQSKLTFEGSAGEQLKKALPDRTIPMRITGTFSKPRPLPDIDPAKLLGGGLVDKIKDKIKIPGFPIR